MRRPRRYLDPKNRPATDPQKQYLRRLFAQCFARHIKVGYDYTHTADRLTVGEASAEIARLNELLRAAGPLAVTPGDGPIVLFDVDGRRAD